MTNVGDHYNVHQHRYTHCRIILKKKLIVQQL